MLKRRVIRSLSNILRTAGAVEAANRGAVGCWVQAPAVGAFCGGVALPRAVVGYAGWGHYGFPWLFEAGSVLIALAIPLVTVLLRVSRIDRRQVVGLSTALHQRI